MQFSQPNLSLTKKQRQAGLDLLLRMDAEYPDLVRSAFWWFDKDLRWHLVFIVREPSKYYKHPLLARIDVAGLDDFRNIDITTVCILTGINNEELWNYQVGPGYRKVAAAYVYRAQLE